MNIANFGFQPTDTNDKSIELRTHRSGSSAFIDAVRFRCASCGKSYWRETHYKEIDGKLELIFAAKQHTCGEIHHTPYLR